jgi:serine/threonine-protein kinase RsbT
MSTLRSNPKARSAIADRGAPAADGEATPTSSTKRGADAEGTPSTRRSSPAIDVVDQVLEILMRYVSGPTARSILRLAEQRKAQSGDLSYLVDESIEQNLRLFMNDLDQVKQCCASLRALVDANPSASSAIVVPIRVEDDIVKARLEGRRLAALAGFSTIGVTRLMTAISEVARNIVLYAGQGQIEVTTVKRGIEIVARDRGPGIANLDDVLAGNYKSRLGMGLGLRGVKKLAETFEIQTAPGRGTTVRFMVRVA